MEKATQPAINQQRFSRTYRRPGAGVEGGYASAEWATQPAVMLAIKQTFNAGRNARLPAQQTEWNFGSPGKAAMGHLTPFGDWMPSLSNAVAEKAAAFALPGHLCRVRKLPTLCRWKAGLPSSISPLQQEGRGDAPAGPPPARGGTGCPPGAAELPLKSRLSRLLGWTAVRQPQAAAVPLLAACW